MTISVEVREHVAIVTLQRPEKRNAVNGEVTAAMTEALDDLEKNPQVRALILTGAGDKAFCAGADLRVAAEGGIDQIAHPVYGFAGFTQRRLAFPTIAAVNGTALAGGFELVLACDLAVAADTATFGIPEVKRGLLAVAGGLVRLPRRVPTAVAFEFGLTGDAIDAARAYQLGLVNRVVPAADVMDAALELAARVAVNAPLAVRATKQILLLAADTTEEEAFARQMELAAPAFASPDVREGPIAFLEKRAPQWADPF